MDCTGPCLKHCYTKNTVLALIIGIFIGQMFYQKVPENKLKMIFGLFVIFIGFTILFIEFT